MFVAADVGSAVKLGYPPYDGADVALSLGSAIGVASGAARAGTPSIAIMGDFGLLHSGLEALVDAARHHVPVVVVVLLNGVQAQTGGQPAGTVEETGALGGRDGATPRRRDPQRACSTICGWTTATRTPCTAC